MSLRSSNGSLLPLHVFRQRLADGADPNELWIKHGSEMEIRIPLLSAVSIKEGKDHLQLLLSHPAIDLQVRDMAGYNALTLAIRLGKKEAIPALIAAGVHVSAADTFGYTPLHHAVNEGNTEALAALITADADIDARDQIGRTPLWLAAASRSAVAVEMLLDAGADAELPDDEGVRAHVVAQFAPISNDLRKASMREATLSLFAQHRRKRLACIAHTRPREQVERRAM